MLDDWFPSAFYGNNAGKSYDYGVLPEMAAILTNRDVQAVSDMRLLAQDVNAFKTAHKDWFDKMDNKARGMCEF